MRLDQEFSLANTHWKLIKDRIDRETRKTSADQENANRLHGSRGAWSAKQSRCRCERGSEYHQTQRQVGSLSG